MRILQKPSGTFLAKISKPFDEALEEFRKEGYQPISFAQEADLRIEHGPKSHYSQTGTRRI